MTSVATIPIRDDFFARPEWWPPKPTRATVDALVSRALNGDTDPSPPGPEAIISESFYNAIFRLALNPGSESLANEARALGYAYVDARAKELGYQA